MASTKGREPGSSDYELAARPDDQPAPDSDDSVAARPERPQAPKPLPRIVRTAPLTTAEADAAEEADDEAPRKRRRSRDASEPAASRGKTIDPETGKTKLEPTPELDTVETRQRVRLLLGGLSAGALVLSIIWIVSNFMPETTSEEAYIDGTELAAPVLEAAPSPRVGANAPSPAAPALPPPGGLASAAPPPAAAPAPAPAPVSPAAELVAATTAPPANATAATPPPDQAEPAPPQPRKLPAGFFADPEATLDENRWPTRIVSERDGGVMVLVPAGRYLIGRNDGAAQEGPAHQVDLPAFYIDETEVTVSQYERYRIAMSRLGETITPRAEELARVNARNDSPVVLVTQTEAQAFARWAGKSLPTEAQWEAAARGPDGRIVPWDSDHKPAPRDTRYLKPVGRDDADVSPSGARDMAGNAWEWTADWYDPRAYDAYQASPAFDPSGPSRSRSNPPQVTVRGSSKSFLSSHREGMKPATRLATLGFRCVLKLDGAPDSPLAEAGAPTSAPAARTGRGLRLGGFSLPGVSSGPVAQPGMAPPAGGVVNPSIPAGSTTAPAFPGPGQQAPAVPVAPPTPRPSEPPPTGGVVPF